MEIRLQTVESGSCVADFVHGRKQNIEPEDRYQSYVQLPSKSPYLPRGVALTALKHLGEFSGDIFFGEIVLVMFGTQIVDFANIVVGFGLGSLSRR